MGYGIFHSLSFLKTPESYLATETHAERSGLPLFLGPVPDSRVLLSIAEHHYFVSSSMIHHPLAGITTEVPSYCL